MKIRYLQTLKTYSIRAIMLAIAVGCGTYVGNPEEDTNNVVVQEPHREIPQDEFDRQRIIISVADAPVDELSEVNIVVSSLSLRSESGEDSWYDLELTGTAPINLLDYQNGEKLPLGLSEDIPLGNYSQIRVILDENEPITAKNLAGEDVAIKAPSATSSGIKINYNITIEENSSTQITLDFDLLQSIKKTGKSYMMRPVIRPSNDNLSARLSGRSNFAILCLYPVDSSVDPATDNCENAVGTTRINQAGIYTFHFVDPGTYNVAAYNTNENDDIPGFVKTVENVSIVVQEQKVLDILD